MIIQKYWKHFLAGCVTVMVIGGAAATFGFEISNPFVMQPEYVVHVSSNARRWIRYHTGLKLDLQYRIYILREQKKLIPPLFFQKLEYHIEKIRKLREDAK